MRPLGGKLVRAAQIAEPGKPPEPVEIEGAGAIEIVAVALNPLDLAVAAGCFYSPVIRRLHVG